ncbi:hypothetical protein AB9Q52_011365 [Pantoea vagans]|uniref:hypothetical protein n=1 Tax=Pantoea vagans TaxID=470934 RepID=UPI003512E89D
MIDDIREALEVRLSDDASVVIAQPVGRVDRGEVFDNNEYPNARVVCLHDEADWENFQDGTKLFLHPAPAVSLAPVSNCLSFFASVIKSGESWSATCQREMDAAREALRNIEEAK